MKLILRWMFLLIFILAFLIGIYFLVKSKLMPIASPISPITSSLSPTASPSATPTPRPLTLAEMNAKYESCAVVPTLMYHHINSIEAAIAGNYQWMNVPPDVFQSQMEYLINRGYTAITSAQLISFFDQNIPLPAKPVLITFDDGYAELVENVFPQINSRGLKVVVFLPTGLMDNPNYLNWNQIAAAGSAIEFGNHTWSHRNSFGTETQINSEIGTADSQLTQHGLNSSKIMVPLRSQFTNRRKNII